ncbi:phage tail tape measure protein [uncultured Megamonas sp.]|uniref:phage tail tape measure protein n=1 Tax=uncultured Megamonas sp. TaxID=286140 RepID=UPI002593A66E|nr:phage tail tape measure protein [uncultured Megamonas sp.]
MASVIDVVLNLVDRVTNPLRTVQREMERTANMNRRLGRDIQKIGDGFSSVGESMLPIAAGITAIGVAGGHAFIDFDSIITGAAAKAGATADEMELMRQKASQFGADFPISATQAAEGMDRLAAAGYDANQVIGVMPSVITAAVASGEDLATTSDVVSNALNIWNLKQGDIEQNAMRVADVVQMAANKSSLGMADFGLAMQYAGAPAATLNVSIEQLATAMAIMKNNGIEASTIGTSLRSVFSRLSEPPKPAAEAIEALGLQVKDASGNFLGLQPIVEQLRGKILNLSNTEQVAYAKALAGEEAYSGLLALVKTAPEDYQALQDAMDSATGSSQAQFEVMKGTLKNSIDGMLGSLESLAINFGTVLTPQIKMITDSIGNFADMINKLSPETKLLIGNVLMGTVAFTGFMLGMGKAISIGGGLVKLYGDIGRAAMGGSIQNKALQFAVTHVVSSFNALKTAFVAVRSAMTLETVAIATASGLSKITSVIKTLITASRAFIFSPLGIALMAIAGIAFLIYQNWETVGPFLIGLWNQIKTALLGAWTQIQPAVTTLMASFARLREVISNAINTVLLALQPAFNAISQLINTVISLGGSVSGMLMPILQSLAVFLGSVFISGLVVVANVITNSIIMAINVATAVITGFLGVLNGVITFLTGVFTGNWGMAWQGIVQVFESIFSTITGVVEGVLSGVKASVNSIIDSINSVKFTVPDFVPGIGGKSFDGLNIPKFAGGTDNFAGGPAIINEEGGEIVDLPSGTRIIPHDKSIQTAYMQGVKNNQSGGNNFSFNINIYGANMKSDEDLDDLADKLMQRIYYQMQKRSINMNMGAI